MSIDRTMIEYADGMDTGKPDLHQDLAALKIDRNAKTGSSGSSLETPAFRLPKLSWPIIGAGLTLFLIIGWFALRTTTPQVVEVETFRVPVSGKSGMLLTVNGYIVSRNHASLGFGRSGKIARINVHEGQSVEKGQKLAELENLEITARLEEARRDFARKKVLYAEKLISQKEIEDAQTRQKIAESQWQDTIIRAPFSGDVVQKLAQVGETVSALGAPGTDAQGIISLADRKNLDVEVDISETSLALVQKGTPAEIIADAFPDKTYHGHLLEIRPSADRAKATVRVKVRIEDPDDKLLPDMGARVQFLSSETKNKTKSTLQVPKSAIQKKGSKQGVYLMIGDYVRLRTVELGDEAGGKVEVKSGLSGGEDVVISSAGQLKDNTKVKVKGRTP